MPESAQACEQRFFLALMDVCSLLSAFCFV